MGSRTLDRQLDVAARSFVAADVEIESSRGVTRVSRIFRWYAKDFGGHAGILAILRKYLHDDEHRAWLVTQGAAVRRAYRPHDWSLNAP